MNLLVLVDPSIKVQRQVTISNIDINAKSEHEEKDMYFIHAGLNFNRSYL